MSNFLPSFIPWWAYILAFLPLYVMNKRSGDDIQRGLVLGIVGRMGSGKSYMATRIAYQRMLRGANIVTNFTMHLECPPSGHKRRHCPCKLASQWQRFNDWPDLLPLTNAVVIIDEADLYAPSHDFHAITDEVRWKMKMARKHKLDIYWIAQHESRVNRILRDVLTNEIAVCRSFFGGKYFSAKFYDPTVVRRARQHSMRKGYFFNIKIASLYDTLETIQGSEYAGDETMANVNKLSQAHNAKRVASRKTRKSKRPTPCEHERAKKIKAGTCELCYGVAPELLEVEEVAFNDFIKITEENERPKDSSQGRESRRTKPLSATTR